MNIIFRMAKFHYFMHLQFKLGLYGENARKQKKSTKYNKTAQKITKLLEVSCYHMWRLEKIGGSLEQVATSNVQDLDS
jgi:hypothetical protein